MDLSTGSGFPVEVPVLEGATAENAELVATQVRRMAAEKNFMMVLGWDGQM